MRDRVNGTEISHLSRIKERNDKQKNVQEKTWSRKARRGDSEVPH